MNIKTGDYVTLKSIKEVKSLYNNWKTIRDEFSRISCIADGVCYKPEMLNVMGLPNVYKVVGVKDDSFLLTLSIFHDDAFWFDSRCIKDVYRLTKIS